MEMGEDQEQFLLQSIEEMSTAHGRWHDTVLYMNHSVKSQDILNVVNFRREEKSLKPLRSLPTVLSHSKAKREQQAFKQNTTRAAPSFAVRNLQKLRIKKGTDTKPESTCKERIV